MIFAVQHFLENHFEHRGLEDVDQYAVRLAHAFDKLPANAAEETVARALGRIRTAFFARNRELDRKEFEARLAKTLRARFQKKIKTKATLNSARD